MRNDIKYMTGRDLDICGERLCVRRGGAPDSEYRQKLISAIDLREGVGSAFGEFHQVGNCSVKTGGMTLRDYFAAKAMQGLCVDAGKMTLESIEEKIPVAASVAYAIADAMLAERAK